MIKLSRTEGVELTLTLPGLVSSLRDNDDYNILGQSLFAGKSMMAIPTLQLQ
jgi:hypothetical protein